MKAVKLLLTIIFSSVLLSSCVYDEIYEEDNGVIVQPPNNSIDLERVLSSYELWYVDYNSTVGTGNVRFMSLAFTMSFINGRVYANNNITEIGNTGNGYGVYIGTFGTSNEFLGIDHVVDGKFDFEVIQISQDEIQIYDSYENVTYTLFGSQRDSFDYDRLFYDNIEYFLQEYEGWEKTARSNNIEVNNFDYENYLGFTPENTTTFYSSKDNGGLDIDDVKWDYIGSYEVFDIRGRDNLKILELQYDLGDVEEFELTVVNDGEIALYHRTSNTDYTFTGRDFISMLKKGKQTEADVSIEGRERTKIERREKNI